MRIEKETNISQIVEVHFEELLKRPTYLPKGILLVDDLKTLPKFMVDYQKNLGFKKEYYKAI